MSISPTILIMIKNTLTNTLSWLLKPSYSLMGRLSFTRKGLVLSFIVAVSFAVITESLYGQLNSQIKMAEKELQGLTILPPILKLTQLMQLHRGASAGVLGEVTIYKGVTVGVMGARHNSSVHLDYLLNKKRDLHRDINTSFETLERVLPEVTLATPRWKKIRAEWRHISSNGMMWSRDQNFNRHVNLIKLIARVRGELMDEFGLLNHPDTDSFYLIDTMINGVIPVQEYLGQVRAVGTGILSKRRLTQEEILKIGILDAQSNEAIESLKYSLSKTSEHNTEISEDLNKASKAISSEAETIFDLVQKDIISEKFEVNYNHFFDVATVAIDNSYITLYEVLLPSVEFLIKDRLACAKRTLWINALVALGMIVFLFYFMLGIYRSMKMDIEEIVNQTSGFSKGDFTKRISLQHSTEFSSIGQSFNNMAESLVLLMDKEQQSLDRIRAIVTSSQDGLIQMNAQGEIINQVFKNSRGDIESLS